MTWYTQSFTSNNHIKSCRLLVPCIHKPGWQETHSLQKKLLKNSAAPIIIIGDLIATGLRRYQHVWRNYSKDALSFGISGDRIENVLWREQDISLHHTASFVIINYSTNTVEKSQTEDFAAGIVKIAETLTKNHPKITTIITGMLPRNKTYSFQQAKINETNKILKAKYRNLLQTYFIDQDDDWVKSNMILNENLHYKDFHHLVETGNEKFSKTICLFIDPILMKSALLKWDYLTMGSFIVQEKRNLWN